MKKWMAWMLVLALALGATAALAEGDELTFETLAEMEWVFSSGAGAWSTELRFGADGTYTGSFHDSDMGESGDGYPGGTLYYSSFNGQMSMAGRADDGAWLLRVDSLTMENKPGEESIEDDVRYVAAEPYGLSEGDELKVYAPGTPADALSEEMQMWAHLNLKDDPSALDSWFIANEGYGSGFEGYAPVDESAGLANPWVDMTEDELWQTAGVKLNLPEGADATAYRWLEAEKMAEMQFTLDGDEYCARVKPAALEHGQVENISGIYYQWENEEAIEVAGRPGTLGIAQTGSEDWVELCLWYDLVPGLMYSLSVSTTDPDGLDLTAVAEVVFVPMQEDA